MNVDQEKLESIIAANSTQVPKTNEPKVIHHFTDTTGALGILQKNEIWLSHARFSNDSEELNQAQKIISRIVRKELKRIPLDEASPKLNHAFAAREFLFKLEHYVGNKSFESHVFIACFCENCDLLSQWRGYTGTAGFSIGFNSRELLESARSMFPDAEIQFMEVMYDHSRWEEELRNKCRSICDYITSLPADSGIGELEALNEAASKRLADYVISTTPFVKHPGFAEEQEWRLTVILPGAAEVTEFRSSRIGILPYIKVGVESAVESVCIGPQQEQFLAMQALELLTVNRSIIINFSNIPLR